MMNSLRAALTAFASLKTPSKISALLQEQGRPGLRPLWANLPDLTKSEIDESATKLYERRIGAVLFGDDDFPESLVHKGRPIAPIIFFQGNQSLLYAPGIGMCGSRSASDLGIRAADACGAEVSRRKLVVVSGYAKGVDTATHLAALRNGGNTVIVLAEGFDHFRIKKDFVDEYDECRVLVVSQFPPSQPWRAYSAMARNHLIFGLSQALVVVEAGERGGTLAAGQGALKRGRPVFVLNFGDETPAGNQILLQEGGRAIHSRVELGSALVKLFGNQGQSSVFSYGAEAPQDAHVQCRLPLGAGH